MKKPKMILFDYGQTLVNEQLFDGVKGTEAVLGYATKNKYNKSAEEVQAYANKLNQELGRFDPEKRHLFQVEVPNYMFTKYLYESQGIEIPLSSEEIDSVFWDAAAPGKSTEGIGEFLTFLKEKQIRTGVISNISYCGNAVTKRINDCIPDNNFEFIIATSEYMYRKPNKHIFELALEKAELRPEEVWYIGDQYQCDIVGANAAGLFPVWYIGAIDLKYESKEDILTIENWKDLMDLLKKLEIAPNTMTKLCRDEEVSLTILSKTLNADFGDIMEHVPDAEIWDLYNENRELLGRDHVRGEQLPIDGYHLVVHVWIRNSKGEYLISQRSANRPTYPLMWECVGGSVIKGEDSLLGAIRETKEEVGIDLEPSNGQVLFTKTRKIIEGKIFNDIMDVWLFEYDGEVDLSNATTDEVAQVAWMNREQIKELFEQKMFVDTLDYFFTETFF